MVTEHPVRDETLITAFYLGHKMIRIYTEKVDSSSLLKKTGHTYLTEIGGNKEGLFWKEYPRLIAVLLGRLLIVDKAFKFIFFF